MYKRRIPLGRWKGNHLPYIQSPNKRLLNKLGWFGALREALPQSVRLSEGGGGSNCYLDIWTMPKCRTNATNVTIALPRQIIWGDIWKGTVEKSQTNATNANLHRFRQGIWRHIWKRTVEKSLTNATNANLHPIMQGLKGHIWKHTAEKSWTNATNVSIHPPRQVIWGRIWKHTVEKSQTNVTYVTLHPLVQTIWGDIWRRTLEESYTSATNVDLPPLRQALWGDIWKCTVGKSRRWDSYLQIACKNADYLRRKGILWICFYGTIFAKKSNRKSNPIFPILSDFFRFLDFSRLPDFPIPQL